MQARLFDLLQDLPRRDHVTQGTQRRVARRQRDDVGLASLLPETFRDLTKLPVGAGLVFTLRIGVQGRTQHALDQHIAGVAVARVVLGDPLLELDVAVHAQLARARRRQPGEVGLHRAGDQDRVGTLGLRFAEIELELAHLVATESHVGQVVTLDQ